VENTASLVVAMGFRKAVVAPALGVIGEHLSQQRELVYERGQLNQTLEKLAALPAERLKQMGDLNYREIRSYAWANLAKVFTELLRGQGTLARKIG